MRLFRWISPLCHPGILRFSWLTILLHNNINLLYERSWDSNLRLSNVVRKPKIRKSAADFRPSVPLDTTGLEPAAYRLQEAMRLFRWISPLCHPGILRFSWLTILLHNNINLLYERSWDSNLRLSNVVRKPKVTYL